jgi:hypothetical protein
MSQNENPKSDNPRDDDPTEGDPTPAPTPDPTPDPTQSDGAVDFAMDPKLAPPPTVSGRPKSVTLSDFERAMSETEYRSLPRPPTPSPCGGASSAQGSATPW